MSSIPIRVLVVDDSQADLSVLTRILTDNPDIRVVGTARSGRECLDLIPHVQPDVICTDLHLTGMDAVEFTRQVMAKHPRPILVLSDATPPHNTSAAFRVLEAGAVDVAAKPASPTDPEAPDFLRKVRLVAGVKVVTRHLHPRAAPSHPLAAPLSSGRPFQAQIVAIGASTGGPQTLQAILSRLPADFPLPILCVQHIHKGFLQGLVDWLSAQCALRIKIAQSGEMPIPGTAYFPQEDRHLKLDGNGKLLLTSDPHIKGHRPSVTVTFESVADHFGSAAIGVLLTGMGSDGANGLQSIARAGGVTIAQDESSCAVFGMPKEAIALGAVQLILPATQIASRLLTIIARQRQEHSNG